jgi:hypothetical protein
MTEQAKLIPTMKASNRYCNKPDRDVPGMVCGYPLPCPFHTIVMHLDADRTSIEAPACANVSDAVKAHLLDIGDAIGAEDEDECKLQP